MGGESISDEDMGGGEHDNRREDDPAPSTCVPQGRGEVVSARDVISSSIGWMPTFRRGWETRTGTAPAAYDPVNVTMRTGAIILHESMNVM